MAGKHAKGRKEEMPKAFQRNEEEIPKAFQKSEEKVPKVMRKDNNKNSTKYDLYYFFLIYKESASEEIKNSNLTYNR